MPRPDPPSSRTSRRAVAAADRSVGRRLAEQIEGLGAAPPAQLRALLADLLSPDSGLQAPLHDLVGRPAFQRLLDSDGTPQRQAIKDRLVEELRETYSPAMTARLEAVLAGLLEPARPAARASPSPTAANAARSGRARPQRTGWLGLVALTAAIALGSGLLFALLRSNRLCPSVGLCLPGGTGREAQAPIEEGLRRSARMVEELESAPDLEAFSAALERLDASLLDLVSRRLTPRQDKQRMQLQERADAAHQRLRREQRAQRSLEEAAALIEQLERNEEAGPQRLDALAEAQARLDDGAGDSFARAERAGLEKRLEAIRNRPPRPAVPSPPAPPTQPAPSSPGASPSAPAPGLAPPPAPVLPPPTARTPQSVQTPPPLQPTPPGQPPPPPEPPPIPPPAPPVPPPP